MKKTSLLLQFIAMLFVLAIAVGCENQMINRDKDLICNGCNANPGGGVIQISCPDLVVYSVISYGHTANVIKFGVVIKNIGNATASISNSNLVGWQAWLSKDGVTRNVAACGSSFYQPLAPGQLSSPSILNCTFPTSVNFNDYKAMIVDLKVPTSIPECSTANNSFVRIPVPL